MAKKMLTAKQAAERLNISPRGVIYLIRVGRLPAEKDEESRMWLIGAKELTDYIRERTKAAKAAEKKKAAKIIAAPEKKPAKAAKKAKKCDADQIVPRRPKKKGKKNRK